MRVISRTERQPAYGSVERYGYGEGTLLLSKPHCQRYVVHVSRNTRCYRSHRVIVRYNANVQLNPGERERQHMPNHATPCRCYAIVVTSPT